MYQRFGQILALLLIALAAFGCGRTGLDDRSVAVVSNLTDGPGDGDMLDGFEESFSDLWPQDDGEAGSPPFLLSEGVPEWDGGETRPPLAQTEPLSPEQVQSLLTRLPSLQVGVGDVEQARLPEQSLPPPRPGEEVDLPFPPPQAEAPPGIQADAPLSVLRYAPEGNIPIAPRLSVTFNQPMVPLGSHRDLAEDDLPVTISPAVPGKWRWVGTKTLFFEADAARMPMATEYSVEIPEGTMSASGQGLAESVSWTFLTPTPTLRRAYPVNGVFGVNPVFFASFDQAIDPAQLIAHVHLSAHGRSYDLRLANEEEMASDAHVQRLVATAYPGRWLAFVASEPLPEDTTVTVTFSAGSPSAEGPLVSVHPQSYSFQTPGPLALQHIECGWSGGRNCDPGEPVRLQFNNPLDAESFEASLVSMEPEPARVSYDVHGSSIWIEATTLGRTTYKVSVDSALTDMFGQNLPDDAQAHFQTGSMQAYLTTRGDGPLTTLDPYGSAAFPITTMNLDAVQARAFRVTPEQYVEFLEWNDQHYDSDQQDPPGQLVMDRRIAIDGQNDVITETNIDLSEALGEDTGHLILTIEPESGIIASLLNRRLRQMRIIRWVQVTQIGLDAFVDADEMQVWTNSLADGAPLAGVDVTLWPRDVSGATDETGSALLALPSESAQLLIARNGEDVALLPQSRYNFHWQEGGLSGWRAREEQDEVRFLVFDDRAMYRPGETVSIKGWMRQIERGPEGDVDLLPEDALPFLHYDVRDSSGNPITSGMEDVDGLGGFHFQFVLPENVNLGYAWIALEASIGLSGIEGARHHHGIQVQEFRRPEYEVGASVSEGPHIAGGNALATVGASYFAGGPLANAEVNWSVEATSASYEPPNWSGFTFGKWLPWWSYDDEYGYLGRDSFDSRTDATGEHSLRIDFLTGDPAGEDDTDAGDFAITPFPVHIDANATVMDLNRQAWSSGAGLLLHPADRYVGLRTERYFVEQGQPLAVEVVVTDIDGNAFEDHSAVVRAARLDWEFRQGDWREIEKEAQECAVQTTAASGPDDSEHAFASCAFETDLGGEYRITATVVDEAGRRNRTELTRWVSGGLLPPSRNVDREEIQLIPDAEEYAPGASAQILVQAPFYPAEGLVTLRRGGLVSSERFTMDGPTYELSVQIEEQYIPNVHVQVDLVGPAVRVDDQGNEIQSVPPRPAYARGRLNLTIPPLERTLRVHVAPQEERLAPGAETTIDVTVFDAAGDPVADAAFAVVVVDEAILALTGYQLIDPIAVFYSDRNAGVNDYHSRANLLLASPRMLGGDGQGPAETPKLSEMMRDEMGMRAYAEAAPAAAMQSDAMSSSDMAEEGASDDSGAQSIRVRLDFNPLALFAPEENTDENGQASVEVTLPDNLTRYRVMVVAVAEGSYFGTGESSLTARLPLMVRPSAPRFLNFGDSFELPVLLQNQTDEAMEAHIVVRAANVTVVADGESGATSGYAVTVPANDRVEVRFPAGTVSAGTARFQFGVVDANQPAVVDAAEVDLPVYTPATTEAFAVYGELDDNGALLQPLRPPSEAIPNYGGLKVTLSSTALQALTDAFIYLVRYPYESSEQIASRILGIAALRDLLTAFEAEGLPAPAELERVIEQDLQTLQALQDYSGGFPIWRRGGEVWPYHSLHVAHALARAQQKGYDVPAGMLRSALDYLRTIEEQVPTWYGIRAQRGLSAYALYVRKLLNDHDPSKARTLIREAGLDDLSLESVGWLLFVLTDDPDSQETALAMRRFLNNRVTETAGAATVASGYSDGDYLLLHSSRRDDAVLLEALVVDQPDSDLIAKLVRGLLGHRKAGRWANTQENVWALLAMDRYFATFESQTPDFVAGIWLGEQYAAGRAFEGRSAENINLNLPMQLVQERAAGEDGDLRLILQKEGQGRLYYRLGLRYAPAHLGLDAADHGFTVEREYEAVDDPDDVRRDEDGVWHVRAGARVRVNLTMVAPSRRVHVALVDSLPAGLEILNPSLAVTAEPPGNGDSSASRRWWWGTWYQHQNLRDDRAEAFRSYLWAGVYQYSYTARATTPGAFVAPPAKAEEMYAPETFGRTATDWVVVEDAGE